MIVASSFASRSHAKIERSCFDGSAAGSIAPCMRRNRHASLLIQTPKQSILIDPNWAKWLKVIKRIRQPGLEIHDLPAIDVVLVTHAHFDHLDRKTLREGEPRVF